jgi:hypothetical protein
MWPIFAAIAEALPAIFGATEGAAATTAESSAVPTVIGSQMSMLPQSAFGQAMMNIAPNLTSGIKSLASGQLGGGLANLGSAIGGDKLGQAIANPTLKNIGGFGGDFLKQNLMNNIFGGNQSQQLSPVSPQRSATAMSSGTPQSPTLSPVRANQNSGDDFNQLLDTKLNEIFRKMKAVRR